MPGRGSGRGPAARDPRRPAPARSTARPARPAPGPTARPSSLAASRRPATARPHRSGAPQPPPAPLWRGLLPDAAGNRRIVRMAVLASLVALLAVLLVPTVRAYLGQRSEIASLQQQVTGQERSVADLQAQQERWKDPAYVEQQARQRLKFVKVGEKAYTVIDAQPQSADVPVIRAASGVPDDLPWYSAVWGSVHAADVPGAPAP